MKLSLLLAALAISYTSLVKSTPVAIPTSPGSNLINIAEGRTIPSGSWKINYIGTEPDTCYREWETKPLDDIEKQANEDEAEANRLIDIYDRERANFHMLRSLTLRFYRFKRLLRVDLARTEIVRIRFMTLKWVSLKEARLKFIGLYLSQIDLLSAYEHLLETGDLPPYTNVEILPDTCKPHRKCIDN
ncbi:hypothetical protein H0H93_014628 [Arthromyces matolae]|nr:hypothetical protein H0H93_014628 [Arthromyces matolae]